MANLVIAAIPNKDDYVWKISSEKIPHMTLLFLGELNTVTNVAQIADFVQHATSTSLKRFTMDVAERGTLGEDTADVLFFNKKYGKEVEDFRAQLLKDNNIFKAYSAIEQFPEWLPHLTLGYPGSPAKEDTREYPGINYVSFDRIALWFGDYEGLEFPLKEYDWDMDVAMSSLEDTLAHYGVKGMKWGVRKASGSEAPAHVRAVKQRKFMKTKVATRGGRGQPATDDAIQARLLQQTFKKSGPNALTNNQLTQLSYRLNLEQNVGRMAGPKKIAGQKWAEDELKKNGSRQVASLVAKKAAKGAAVAAVAA